MMIEGKTDLNDLKNKNKTRVAINSARTTKSINSYLIFLDVIVLIYGKPE